MAIPDAGTVRVDRSRRTTRESFRCAVENLAADEHATGVVVDGDNVYVERDHGPLVRIGSTNGTADGARTEIPGRPSRDGRLYLSGGITDPDQGRYWVNVTDRATGMHRYTLALHSVLTLREMMLLDTDRAGTIYVAVMGLTPRDRRSRLVRAHSIELPRSRERADHRARGDGYEQPAGDRSARTRRARRRWRLDHRSERHGVRSPAAIDCH